MSTCHSTARWALALFCALAIGAHLQAAQATLSASVTKTVIESDKKQTVFLKVGLTGFAMEAEHKRAGVNVALVIDRSGSMVGEKMERAKEAAIVAVDRLNADDIVSVIVFDHTVEVLVPSTKLTDKEAVRKAIRTITAKVYVQYSYDREKREALSAWGERLGPSPRGSHVREHR